MNNGVDAHIEKIINHPIFLKLKDVVEHNDGWHHHEPVYDHCLKTMSIAKRELAGDFITNEKAKQAFLTFMNEEVAGMKRGDIAILVALLHDCGKLLSYTEGDQTKPMLSSPTTHPDFTFFPGHEYWGSAIVLKEILKEITITDEIKEYIAKIVNLHGRFSSRWYFTKKELWAIETIASDAKGWGEGYHLEALFNSYCDCFDAAAFALGKEKIIQLFNTPSLYTKRTYFIP